jgi:hypothetical protein
VDRSRVVQPGNLLWCLLDGVIIVAAIATMMLASPWTAAALLLGLALLAADGPRPATL